MTPTGELDRGKIGRIVFSNPTARRRLNKALQLPLSLAIIGRVLKAWFLLRPVCVIDMPLLFEVGADKLVAESVLVYVSPESQTRRLMARDGITDRAEAAAKISAQMPLDAKRRRATTVIDNEGTFGVDAHAGQLSLSSFECLPSSIRDHHYRLKGPAQGRSQGVCAAMEATCGEAEDPRVIALWFDSTGGWGIKTQADTQLLAEPGTGTERY